MEECHGYVAIVAPHLIQNKHAFESNDMEAIQAELRLVLSKIDRVVHRNYDLKSLVKAVHEDRDFPLSDIFREFYTLVMTYLSDPRCIGHDERVYANIIRSYLCDKGARNLAILYHFIANIGLIMAGCTRIYLVDKTNRGKHIDIITDPEFFLAHIHDPVYRVSKSRVKECLETTRQRTGLSDLLVARSLISISRSFRRSIAKTCPIIYENWSELSKHRHEQFETELAEFTRILDEVVSKCSSRSLRSLPLTSN